MKLFLCIAIPVANFVIFFCLSIARHRGYTRGLQQGYKMGRKDADDWWIATESEIDQARKKSWRESA
jgi:hypothetical protein